MADIRIPTFDRMLFPFQIKEKLFEHCIVVMDENASVEIQARMWLRCLLVSEQHEDHWFVYDRMPYANREYLWKWRNEEFFKKFPQYKEEYDKNDTLFGEYFEDVVDHERSAVMLGLARVMTWQEVVYAIHSDQIDDEADDAQEKADKNDDDDFDYEAVVQAETQRISERAYDSPLDEWWSIAHKEKEEVTSKINAMSDDKPIPEKKVFVIPTRGYVYVMVAASTKHIKIGNSKNPTERAKTLSKGLPHGWQVVFSEEFADAETAERYIHKKFDDLREDKEFFKVKPDKATREITELRKRIDNDQCYQYLRTKEKKCQDQVAWVDTDSALGEKIYPLFQSYAVQSIDGVFDVFDFSKLDAIITYQEHYVAKLSLSSLYEVCLLRLLKKRGKT